MAPLKTYRRIPGPRSTPFVGNALNIGSVQPWLQFEEWAQEYGSLVRFRIFDDEALLVNDPALIRQVLLEQSTRFHKIGQLKPLRPVLTTSVFIAPHREWARRRRQHPFERVDLKSYFAGVLAPMRAHARKRVSAFAASSQPIRVHKEMERLVFELFGIAVLNDPLDDEWWEEWFELLQIGSRRVRSPVPLPVSKRTRDLRKKWFGRLRRRIRARLDTDLSGRDLLDTTLREGHPEDLEHFVTEMGTVFFGGVGAVSTTFTAMLRSLTLYPGIRRALCVGIEGFADAYGQDYSLDELDTFDLLRRTVDESLRLEASVPFFLRAAATDNAQVGGYSIPRGVKVFISPWVLHRTERYWPRPLRFDASRFIEKPAPFSFIPFGAGPRECVGKAFATFCTRVAFATFFESHRPEVDVNTPYARRMDAGNYVPSVTVPGRFPRVDPGPDRGRIRGTNAHTSSFAKAVIEDAHNARAFTVDDIMVNPPGRGVETRFFEPLGMEVTMEDYASQGMDACTLALTQAAMQTLPMHDSNTRWKSPDEARKTLSDLFPGMLEPTVHWPDPTGDQALQLLVTQGIGAHLLKRAPEGGFQVDLRWMGSFAVRKPFLPFGGRLLLGDDLSVRQIEVDGQVTGPDDGMNWKKAKLRIRSAILAEVTIVQHLVLSHFVVNNCCIVASRRVLGPHHPIRRLLLPFHYRGPTINRDALVVNIGYHAMLQRIFGFTWDGMKAFYKAAVKRYRLETFPDELRRRGVEGLAGYPYGSDGLAFWNSAHSYVTRYFDAVGLDHTIPRNPRVARWLKNWDEVCPATVRATTREELIDLCTHQIFNSTAFHAHVGGNLGNYVHDLAFMPAVLRDEKKFADMLPSINTTIQVYMLAVATNLSMPKLMDDWAHLMIETELQQLVRTWQLELGQLGERIARLNAERPMRYPTFEPAHLKLSISF